jgi:hypothetical protein
MLESFLNFDLYLLVDIFAFALLVFLTYRTLWKRLPALWAYLFAFLVIDGVARRYVLYHYGIKSTAYIYFYWITDAALALGLFLLICTFFQRACANESKLWQFLRLFLVFVFVLVLGISAFTLSRNYDNLFSRFIYEFNQNLYFSCLVLNTLLYIMMQQIENADDELHMLVCGLGLQFAGPAANFALMFLTPDNTSPHLFAKLLFRFLGPLCTVGMLLTWFYAVVKMPKPAEARASMKLVPVVATSPRAA